jgi:hypothetical protein
MMLLQQPGGMQVVSGGVAQEWIQLREKTLWTGGPCRLRTTGVALNVHGADAKLKRLGNSVVEIETRLAQG